MENQALKLEDVAIIRTKKPQSIRRYKCPYLGCNKEFSNSADLAFHIKFEHLKLLDPPPKKEKIQATLTKLKYLNLKMQIKAYVDFVKLYFKEKEYLKGEMNGNRRN
ncbi:MAG: hypothetical protein ACP5LI_07915 [Hydrogenobaculum sp.]